MQFCVECRGTECMNSKVNITMILLRQKRRVLASFIFINTSKFLQNISRIFANLFPVGQ